MYVLCTSLYPLHIIIEHYVFLCSNTAVGRVGGQHSTEAFETNSIKSLFEPEDSEHSTNPDNVSMAPWMIAKHSMQTIQIVNQNNETLISLQSFVRISDLSGQFDLRHLLDHKRAMRDRTVAKAGTMLKITIPNSSTSTDFDSREFIESLLAECNITPCQPINK